MEYEEKPKKRSARIRIGTSIFAFTGVLVGSGAGLFFDYTPPESIQPLFGIAWISMIIGFGYGSYVAWGDKMSSSTE